MVVLSRFPLLHYMICVFAAHPWLRDENPGLLLDFSVYKLVRSYIRASPFRRSALKVVS